MVVFKMAPAKFEVLATPFLRITSKTHAAIVTIFDIEVGKLFREVLAGYLKDV